MKILIKQFSSLTDRYISASLDAASLTDTQKNIELVKLGAELHGPEDAVFIEKSQVLFWENMKDSSKVLEAIKQYQASTN